MKPRVSLQANIASGTSNPTSRLWSTFDQQYPSSHDKLDFADQVGWRNIEQVRGAIDEGIGKKVKVRETYEEFWLHSRRDALYSSSGAPVVQSSNGTAGRHVGGEFDVYGTYDVSKALTVGAGYARFFTGGFLNRTTAGKDYNYPWVFANYYF